MCGIAGWVAYDRDLRPERPVLDAMTETMACRGPDDRGTWLSRRAALGHRRLAVIDLPGGRQPMRVDTPDGPVVLVYGGEAYNFQELRTELAGRGQRFTTRSDTEVVLRGYLEWGTGVASRLNGMYGLAIWDGRTQRLVMIRDRLGVKPLYYYRLAGGVLFGSEAKAILAHPQVECTVGLEGLRELVAHIRTPGLATWEGMDEVPPGTVVTVDVGGLRVDTYWSLRSRPHRDDQAASVARVRELLEDIVARQLVADVPRCTLLSGGLDSSALTALAARQLAAAGQTLRSFAVDFEEHAAHFVAGRPQLSLDTPYVREVAGRLGTRHQDVVLAPEQLADPRLRARTVRALDLPGLGGDREISLYLLFREIRAHSTVALSGESADEVFGGYPQFFDPAVREADTFPWLAHFSPQIRQERAGYTPELLAALDLDAYARDCYRSAVAPVERPEGESDLDYQLRKVNYLHITRFVRGLLDRKDRLSMAVGLEVRVPYCDHRLVSYVYNIPWALKTYDGREKSLLRGAVAHLVPASVRNRVKSGYPAIPHPRYLSLLQRQARELHAQPAHPVFALVRRDWLGAAARADPATQPHPDRLAMEQFLGLAQWLDLYRPTLRLS